MSGTLLEADLCTPGIWWQLACHSYACPRHSTDGTKGLVPLWEASPCTDEPADSCAISCLAPFVSLNLQWIKDAERSGAGLLSLRTSDKPLTAVLNRRSRWRYFVLVRPRRSQRCSIRLCVSAALS